MIYIHFIIVLVYRWFLGKISNIIVELHFRLTPRRSTDDSLREMILEQVRFRQRKIEQKRWSLRLKLEELAKKAGVEWKV